MKNHFKKRVKKFIFAVSLGCTVISFSKISYAQMRPMPGTPGNPPSRPMPEPSQPEPIRPMPQPEPQPQPEPVRPMPQPDPQPYPQPEPTPYPQPEPTPYPQPEPTPYPQPEPTPYPQPEPTPAPAPSPSLSTSSIVIPAITRKTGGEWKQAILIPAVSIDSLVLVSRNARLLVHEVQVIDVNGKSHNVDLLKEHMIEQNDQISVDLSQFDVATAINLRVESYGGHADLNVTTLTVDPTNLSLRKTTPLE